MKHEREFRQFRQAEIRVRSGGKSGIEGYAAVFNQISEELWPGVREMIMPGAFKDCLSGDPDVRCLFNHDSNFVLGRTRAKTLTLTEDDKGLHFNCDTPDTQAARDLMTSISRGDVDQCSFGFYVRKETHVWETDKDGEQTLLRQLNTVDLFDVSPVTFAAYPQTSVDTRSLWPDGLPTRLRLIARELRQDDEKGETAAEPNDNGCECECQACQDDDCENCTDAECDDPNCEHEDSRKLRQNRGAIAFKKTPAVDSASWDGNAATNRLAKWASSDGSGDKDKMNWSKYAQGFAWVDPDQKENFGGYKLPHHDIRDGRLVSSWGGVKAAMTALLGGRGGTSIPESDRRAVYNHLASEYKLHDKDVPDFHSLLLDAETRWQMQMRLDLVAR